MTTYKLTYFPVTGLGEALRLAFAAGGLDFEDERLGPEGIDEKRSAGELPYGQVPVLEIDGAQYGQSNAILRYIGRQTGMYPLDDPIACMKIDGVIDAMQDAVVACFTQDSAEARKTFVEEKIPKFFRPIDTMIKAAGGNFVTGDEMTIADIKVYSIAKILAGGMKVEHVPTDCLAEYEYLQKLVKAVGEHEKIAAWNEAHA